jgi:DNA-binding transcriptional LysR family regulator
LSLGVLPSLASGIATTTLAKFQRLFPHVRITLRERKHDDLLHAVRFSEVEIGVGVLLKPDDDLSFGFLFDDHLLFVVPEGHPLIALPGKWACLEQYPFIFVGHGNIEHALAVSGVRALAAFEVEHVATALAMVRHGMGISVLPSSVIPSLNVEGLICLPIDEKTAVRRLGIICKRGRQLSNPAKAFVDILEQSVLESDPGQGKRSSRARPAAS